MERIAAFVDAGYLYAQGAVCIAKEKLARDQLALNERAAIEHIKALCREKSPNASLLRIYWYDVKVRLGFINSVGQQKGVDSLIITDLIELARNHAISDALLVSGDEDIRIGVQIAQSFGVRIHLIGIQPAKGSQSLQLQQEADTCTELREAELAPYLSRMYPSQPSAAASSPINDNLSSQPAVDIVASSYAKSLSQQEITNLLIQHRKTGSVPPGYDGPLLAQCRTALGADLLPEQRRRMREAFVESLQNLEKAFSK
jgi:hypothetical protein